MASESIVQYGASLEREMQAQANSLSTRLSTWIMAGHGAALLLCFNALVAGHICDWSAIRPLTYLFLCGLGAGFLAIVFKMCFLERLALRWMKVIPKMLTAASGGHCIERLSQVTPLEKEHSEALDGDISRNEKAVRTELDQIREIANVPGWINWLSRISDIFLMMSVLSFAAALVCAIEGDPLIGAFCSSR